MATSIKSRTRRERSPETNDVIKEMRDFIARAQSALGYDDSIPFSLRSALRRVYSGEWDGPGTRPYLDHMYGRFQERMIIRQLSHADFGAELGIPVWEDYATVPEDDAE